MTDRPILFSAAMVCALLDGRKTQTRRVIKPQPLQWRVQVIDVGSPTLNDEGEWGQWETVWSGPLVPGMCEPDHDVWHPIRTFRKGDRLWVRETWGVGTRPCPNQGWRDGIEYRADEMAKSPFDHGPLPLHPIEPPEGVEFDDLKGEGWRPSIFMPRWASRLTLKVTDVRIERLADISEKDAVAEGIKHIDSRYWQGAPKAEPSDRPVIAYARLWELINGKGSWLANPYVTATTFTVEKRNIDA